MRKYGWIPDPPDKRDLYLKVARFRRLPRKVDLRWRCSAIENQGAIGSCSAQAFVAVMEYLDRKDDDNYVDLSRLFVYYNTREDKKEDTGGYLRDGIKALAKYGACDERVWPYLPYKFATEPSEEAYEDGKKRRISEYRRIDKLKGVKQSLADGFPVVFGFTVYQSFESEEVARTGIMTMPPLNDIPVGGHAVVAVGYDDDKQYLIVRNSWGPEWGDQGYFYMPYSYVDNEDLTADFWSIIRFPMAVGVNVEEVIDLKGEDVKWYVPITSIYRGIKIAWTWLKKRLQ